jgi:ABC-type dipeptide/oligopeptide/nickel transport system permease subunit
VSNIAPELPPPGLEHVADGGAVGPVQSGWRLAAREFARNKLAVLGLGALIFFVVFCYLGPYFYHGGLTSDLTATNVPPSIGHPLGTDNQGFDVLEELMVGGRNALEIGFLSALIGMVIGAVWGAVAGLAGGLFDGFLMRIVDVLLSIPFLFVVLIVAVRYGATVLGLSVIIGIFTWQVPARLVRGEVLTLRVRDFVAAARAAGAGQARLVNRHLLPNSLGVIIVTATFSVADAILAVATLGFLGFGLQYPTFDWGDMLNNGITYLQDGYWWQVYPVGIAIIVVVMACNLLGDALRDALDVRLRRR